MTNKDIKLIVNNTKELVREIIAADLDEFPSLELGAQHGQMLFQEILRHKLTILRGKQI